MRELEYFITSDELDISVNDETSLIVVGRVWCEHETFVDVRQILALNSLGQTRVVNYSYHAGLVGVRSRSVFRYDNAHTYAREMHPDAHHKHRYDPVTWEEIRPPVWIGVDHRPHIWDVIAELHGWWLDVGQYVIERDI